MEGKCNQMLPDDDALPPTILPPWAEKMLDRMVAPFIERIKRKVTEQRAAQLAAR